MAQWSFLRKNSVTIWTLLLFNLLRHSEAAEFFSYFHLIRFFQDAFSYSLFYDWQHRTFSFKIDLSARLRFWMGIHLWIWLEGFLWRTMLGVFFNQKRRKPGVTILADFFFILINFGRWFCSNLRKTSTSLWRDDHGGISRAKLDVIL